MFGVPHRQVHWWTSEWTRVLHEANEDFAHEADSTTLPIVFQARIHYGKDRERCLKRFYSCKTTLSGYTTERPAVHDATIPNPALLAPALPPSLPPGRNRRYGPSPSRGRPATRTWGSSSSSRPFSANERPGWIMFHRFLNVIKEHSSFNVSSSCFSTEQTICKKKKIEYKNSTLVKPARVWFRQSIKSYTMLP